MQTAAGRRRMWPQDRQQVSYSKIRLQKEATDLMRLKGVELVAWNCWVGWTEIEFFLFCFFEALPHFFSIHACGLVSIILEAHFCNYPISQSHVSKKINLLLIQIWTWWLWHWCWCHVVCLDNQNMEKNKFCRLEVCPDASFTWNNNKLSEYWLLITVRGEKKIKQEAAKVHWLCKERWKILLDWWGCKM